MKWIEKIDNRMEAKSEKSKALWQFVKFNLVSFCACVLQLVLVNVLCKALSGWKAELPDFLESIFSEDTVGAGNNNWGYVLPFLLSNLIANIFAYLMNQKTTFKADSSKLNFVIYLLVLFSLILFSTWLQGVIVNAICTAASPFWQRLSFAAPTIASLSASTFQFLVLFPLEKFVLLREKKKS